MENAIVAWKSKGEVVVTLINAAMDPQYAGLPAQNQFINKVTISNYTADIVPTAPDVTDLSTFVEFISDVTDDNTTVTDAKITVDEFFLDIQEEINTNDIDDDGDGYTENQGDCDDGIRNSEEFRGIPGTPYLIIDKHH